MDNFVIVDIDMEKAPKVSNGEVLRAMMKQASLPEAVRLLVQDINDHYEYWDKVKYKLLPQGFTHDDLWRLVVADRKRSDIMVWKKYHIHFALTSAMLLSEFAHGGGHLVEPDGGSGNNTKGG